MRGFLFCGPNQQAGLFAAPGNRQHTHPLSIPPRNPPPMLDLVAAFIGLTTLLTYLNYRFIRLPPAIGVMATALLLSLALHGLTALGYPLLEQEMQQLIREIDFSQILMTWFLPALLFAGALHVDFRDLASYKWSIGFLATIGVLLSTFVTATLAYYTFALFGWEVSYLYCLLFSILIGIHMLGEAPTAQAISWLFVKEALGGILFGLVLGYGFFFLLRTVSDHQVVVMLTLALVFAGAALSARLHVSAPIVAV